jgi:hypothetical protein
MDNTCLYRYDGPGQEFSSTQVWYDSGSRMEP